MAAPVGGMYYHGDPSPKGATVVRTRTLPAEAKGNLGSMPVLVNHASSLSPAEPRGPLIPTNVRPPQCPTISGRHCFSWQILKDIDKVSLHEHVLSMS